MSKQYNATLQTYNAQLQALIDTANSLPEAGGIELPELTNEGTAADLLAGKELIDGDGNVVQGTMPNGSAKTPATTITKNPSISVNSSGLITASVSGTQSVTPTVTAGYVSSGTAGTITVAGSTTKQLTTQAAKTVTPTKSSQTAVAKNVYTTGAVTVASIPAEYIIPSDEFAITSNGIYDITNYASANVNVSGGAAEDLDTELDTQETKLNQLLSVLDTKATNGSINPSVPKKDVNFYDYDGTILYSYTVQEAQALTELPPLPTRFGLICQGWNYDLATIKSYNSAVNIGAMYITDDGSTRLYIRIAAEDRMTVPLYFRQTVTNGVVIDWGDGSATKTLSGTGYKNTVHTYTKIGDYVITLNVMSGSLRLGHNCCVIGTQSINTLVYRDMLKKAEIGAGITILDSMAFYDCPSLTSITIPNGITSIDYSTFDNCTSLTSITIPSSVTSIREYAFYNCKALTSITIPSSVTSIREYMFSDCYSLTSVIIPNSITNISGCAFHSCVGMTLYDFSSHTSIPTLNNTNAFSAIPFDCIIKVPVALYDEWIAATNWSSFSSQIKSADAALEPDLPIIKGNFTFRIDGVVYAADEDMTWEEWVNSEYNTDNFEIVGSAIEDKDGAEVSCEHKFPHRIDGSWSSVDPSDSIAAYFNYSLVSWDWDEDE